MILDRLEAELDKEVVEHDIFRVVVGWKRKTNYLAIAELSILWIDKLRPHVFREESHSILGFLDLGKVHKDSIEFGDSDKACGVAIVLRPHGHKVVEGFITDWQFRDVSLPKEGVDNDGDE